MITLRHIMRTPVVTVLLDDFLRDVKAIFDAGVVQHVIVVEDSRLVGVIDERDLLRVISPYLITHVYTTRDLATLNQRVHQVVTRNATCLPLDATVQRAIDVFNAQAIDCIPVVDAQDEPVGLLTRADIVRNFYAICSEGRGLR